MGQHTDDGTLTDAVVTTLTIGSSRLDVLLRLLAFCMICRTKFYKNALLWAFCTICRTNLGEMAPNRGILYDLSYKAGRKGVQPTYII